MSGSNGKNYESRHATIHVVNDRNDESTGAHRFRQLQSRNIHGNHPNEAAASHLHQVQPSGRKVNGGKNVLRTKDEGGRKKGGRHSGDDFYGHDDDDYDRGDHYEGDDYYGTDDHYGYDDYYALNDHFAGNNENVDSNYEYGKTYDYLSKVSKGSKKVQGGIRGSKKGGLDKKSKKTKCKRAASCVERFSCSSSNSGYSRFLSVKKEN